MEEIIRAENISKIYGENENSFTALDNVSLSVRKGEFVAITGASGSGKTTLLNIIGALDTPTKGNLYFKNELLTGKSDEELSIYRRRNIGFVFQSFNLVPVLNVEENIALSLSLDNKEPDREYLEELLEMTGLKDKRHSFPFMLSGGQKQRTAFARALIHKPEIILADEPTGNLDSKNGAEILSALTYQVKNCGRTLILITHDMEMAKKADRIITISDGKITGGDAL